MRKLFNRLVGAITIVLLMVVLAGCSGTPTGDTDKGISGTNRTNLEEEVLEEETETEETLEENVLEEK